MNTSLTEIYNIGVEGGNAIGRGIESEDCVTSIGLYGNKIGVEAGKASGEGLKVNTSLTIDWNEISVEGAKAIGEALNEYLVGAW